MNFQDLPMAKNESTAREMVILIAEDDAGHARLIEKSLQRAGLHNRTQRFEDGQDVLNFFFRHENAPKTGNGTAYLLLLDVRMPKVDGVEVLRKLKADDAFCRMPVIMLSTTDDPREVARCHELGCSNYIVKPVDYEKFSEAVQQLGLFISLIQVPEINCP